MGACLMCSGLKGDHQDYWDNIVKCIRERGGDLAWRVAELFQAVQYVFLGNGGGWAAVEVLLFVEEEAEFCAEFFCNCSVCEACIS